MPKTRRQVEEDVGRRMSLHGAGYGSGDGYGYHEAPARLMEVGIGREHVEVQQNVSWVPTPSIEIRPPTPLPGGPDGKDTPKEPSAVPLASALRDDEMVSSPPALSTTQLRPRKASLPTATGARPDSFFAPALNSASPHPRFTARREEEANAPPAAAVRDSPSDLIRTNPPSPPNPSRSYTSPSPAALPPLTSMGSDVPAPPSRPKHKKRAKSLSLVFSRQKGPSSTDEPPSASPSAARSSTTSKPGAPQIRKKKSLKDILFPSEDAPPLPPLPIPAGAETRASPPTPTPAAEAQVPDIPPYPADKGKRPKSVLMKARSKPDLKAEFKAAGSAEIPPLPSTPPAATVSPPILDCSPGADMTPGDQSSSTARVPGTSTPRKDGSMGASKRSSRRFSISSMSAVLKKMYSSSASEVDGDGDEQVPQVPQIPKAYRKNMETIRDEASEAGRSPVEPQPRRVGDEELDLSMPDSTTNPDESAGLSDLSAPISTTATTSVPSAAPHEEAPADIGFAARFPVRQDSGEILSGGELASRVEETSNGSSSFDAETVVAERVEAADTETPDLERTSTLDPFEYDASEKASPEKRQNSSSDAVAPHPDSDLSASVNAVVLPSLISPAAFDPESDLLDSDDEDGIYSDAESSFEHDSELDSEDEHHDDESGDDHSPPLESSPAIVRASVLRLSHSPFSGGPGTPGAPGSGVSLQEFLGMVPVPPGRRVSLAHHARVVRSNSGTNRKSVQALIFGRRFEGDFEGVDMLQGTDRSEAQGGVEGMEEMEEMVAVGGVGEVDEVEVEMATPTLISFSESGERIPWREAMPRAHTSDADDNAMDDANLNANANDDDNDNDSLQSRPSQTTGRDEDEDEDEDVDIDSQPHSHSQARSEPSTSHSTPSLDSLSRGWSSSTNGSDSPPPATPSTLSTLGLASVHFPSMPSLSLSIAIPSTMPESEYDLASSGTPATASFYSFDSEGVGRGYGSFGLHEEGGEDDDEAVGQGGEEEDEEDEREVFESPMSYSAGFLPELDENDQTTINQEAEDVIPDDSKRADPEDRVEKLKPTKKNQQKNTKQKWWQFSKRGGSVPVDVEISHGGAGKEAVNDRAKGKGKGKARGKAKAEVNSAIMERRGTVPLPAVPAE